MIFTFYSFKGGVGRSMALANIAEVFYARGLKVLMVDFDLEAPGLERYFDVKESMTPSLEIQGRPGVIDFVLSFLELQSLAPKLPPAASPDSDGKPSFPYSVEPLRNFISPIYDEPSRPGKLSLMSSGNRSKPDFGAYAKKVLDFDWPAFYTERDGERFFEWFRLELKSGWDVILIDSRTGVTELGGVCTHHLADAVISFVATNQQNLEGSEMMARSLARKELVTEGRKGRDLHQLFVPSRVEVSSEEDKHDDFAARFDQKFGPYIPPNLTPEKGWFIDLRLSYVPAYSYMERVAVREPERASKADLIQAYLRLASRMASLAKSGPLLEAWTPPSALPSNLPPRNLNFTGREDDLKQIRAFLSAGTPVAICGLGGMGKTTLAVEYVCRFRNDYSVTLFCAAGSDKELRRGCEEAMGLLGIAANADIIGSVRRWLDGNDRWMLVLDGVVDLTVVRAVLPQSPRGQVLITTRTQHVPSQGAQPLAIGSLSRESSIKLLQHRLGSRDWTDDDLSAAGLLADELSGLPLALEQAAAHMDTQGSNIHDYWLSFRKRGLELLDRQKVSYAGRRSSLSDVLVPALEQIQKYPASADVLRLASFLPSSPIPVSLLADGAKELGEWISSLLSSAIDDPLVVGEMLEPLAAESLIERQRDLKAFSVHPLVAKFVRERNADSNVWHDRLVAALEAAFPEPRWDNVATCAGLLPHVLAVLTRAKRPRLRLRVVEYLIMRAEYARAREFLQGIPTSIDDRDNIVADQLQASIYFVQSRFKEALAWIERGLSHSSPPIDEPRYNQMLLALARTKAALGDLDEAENIYGFCLRSARESGNPRSLILSLCGRATIIYRTRPNQGIEDGTEAMNHAERENTDLQAIACYTVASVLIETGHAKETRTKEILQKALNAGERVYGTQHPDFALMLRLYAVLLHINGQAEQGEAAYSRAQEIIDSVLGSKSTTAGIFRGEFKRMIVDASKEMDIKPSNIASQNAVDDANPSTTLDLPNTGDRWIKIGIIAVLLLLAAAGLLYIKAKTVRVQTPTPPEPILAGTPTEQRGASPAIAETPVAPAWGVLVSTDRILEAQAPKGPSASWEPVLAELAGFPGAVILQRDSYFMTVIPASNRATAESILKKVMAVRYGDSHDASVIQVTSECTTAKFDRTLKAYNTSVDIFDCDSASAP